MTQIDDPSAAGFSPMDAALAFMVEEEYQQARADFLAYPPALADFAEDLDHAANMANSVNPLGARARLLADPEVDAMLTRLVEDRARSQERLAALRARRDGAA